MHFGARYILKISQVKIIVIDEKNVRTLMVYNYASAGRHTKQTLQDMPSLQCLFLWQDNCSIYWGHNTHFMQSLLSQYSYCSCCMKRFPLALKEQTVSHSTSKASFSLLGFQMSWSYSCFRSYKFSCAHTPTTTTTNPPTITWKSIKKKKKRKEIIRKQHTHTNSRAIQSTLRHNPCQGYLIFVSEVLTSRGRGRRCRAA